MSSRSCPKCGGLVPFDASFCPSCGTDMIHPLSKINTHAYGWMALSFVFSLLWFKVNNVHVFPLGFIGGLIVAYWSYDIDKSLGKKTHMGYSIIVSIVGMIIGAITR